MKTIIVTGGCGYIGSHVARAFKYADPNNRVYIIDRVSRRHTLKHVDGFFINDFASESSLATIVDLNPDIIVHCAGTSLVGPSMTDPAEYYDNNVVKTIALMNLLKDLDKKPLVMFSSSASVYGNPAGFPIAEESTKHPISPYGSTKLTDEMILNDYGRSYGINTVIFRYFNAAGAEPNTFDLGQEPNATHIVARVLEASINKRVFSLYGDDYDTPDGTCVRDYVHVWDIATAHTKAAEFVDKVVDSGTVNLTYNLGTNQGVSNREIIDYVAQTYGLVGVNFSPRRAGDPATLIADARAANLELQWHPKYSNIKTIIDTAYKWYTR